MKRRNRGGLAILAGLCALLLLVGEATVLLVLPLTTGLPLGETYASFGHGSLGAVVVCAALWFVLTAAVVATRVRRDRNEGSGRLQFLVSVLVCIGVAGAGLFFPWSMMDVALEHVRPGETRYASPIYAAAEVVWTVVWVGAAALVSAAGVATATAISRKSRGRFSASNPSEGGSN